MGTGTYRADLDGLRAIAVLVVVAFHVGLPGFSGGYIGVDVFFALSGYLITTQLLRDATSGRPHVVSSFYARRVRRLLPLSTLVLATTTLVGVALVAPTSRLRLIDDIRAATLYVSNWRFADQTTSYSDILVTDSPALHMWSLSIEEQFYLGWPLLVVGTVALASKLNFSPRAAVGLVCIATIAASFATSVALTASVGTQAYYLTHARLWEIVAGALLAITSYRIASRFATVAAAFALAAIAIATFSYGADTPYPGWRAAVPVVAGLVIIAAHAQGAIHDRLLGSRPLAAVGRLSYGWYLWHWPTIGMSHLWVNRNGWSIDPRIVGALAAILALGLSAATYRLVENRVRYTAALVRSQRRSLALGALLVAFTLGLLAVVERSVDLGDEPLSRSGVELVQTPAAAAADIITADRSCHASFEQVDLGGDCRFGDPDGERIFVIVGDSHARQWVDAIDVLGQEKGWQVYAFTKSSCLVYDLPIQLKSFGRAYTECDRWRANLDARLATIGPIDTIVFSRASSHAEIVLDGSNVLPSTQIDELWKAAFTRTIERFASLAKNVILIRDPPWLDFDPIGCLSLNRQSPSECNFERTPALRDDWILDMELEDPVSREITVVDPTDAICPVEDCSLISDEGMIIYRDTHHLTRSFTLSLVPELEAWLSPSG